MLLCLTASHKNTSIDLLERLSVSTGVAESLMADQAFVSGCIVVSTCNRYEVYLDVDEPLTAARAVATEAAIEVVSAASGVEVDTLRTTFDVLCEHDATEHVFAVAAGLESVVVGEGEVAGQVRRSLESARENRTTSSLLEQLFQQASGTSRRVKNTTSIASAGRSLVRLALDLAETRISDWAQTPVLLIGTGRYAAASLAALRERGVTHIAVYSPSGRGGEFAAAHGIRPVDPAGYAREAAETGVVVACSAVVDPVLDKNVLEAGRRDLAAAVPSISAGGDGTQGIRQLIIDLGLPRNVDHDVAQVSGVELLDLDTVRLHAPLEQTAAPARARRLVGSAARRFAEAAAEREVAPAVVALRKHVYDVLDAEIERARPHDSDGHTEAALRHLAGVLLHTPMVQARRHARAGRTDEFAAGLEALFGIQLPDAEASDGEAEAAPGS